MAYINYSPWQDAASFGQGLGHTLTQLLVGLPLSRSHQAYYDAETQAALARKSLYEAEVPYQTARAGAEKEQGRYYGSMADYNKNRADEISAAELAKIRLGNSLRQIPTTLALGGSINPLISDAVDNLARLSNADRHGLGEQLAQLLNMSNPRFQHQLGLGQHGMVPVPSQGSLYNAVTGAAEYEMPQKLTYGQGLYPTQGGDSLAIGPDRPLSAQNFGNVYGRLAQAVIETPELAGASPEEVTSAVSAAINQLRGGIGGGMPRGGGGATNVTGGAVGKARKNPRTGEWELVR